MFFEIGAIAFGLLVSFFLKDINFLGLNFEFISTGVVYPDFLMIFVIFFSLHKGEFSGLWIGFFAGLLEDSGLLSFVGGEFIPIIGVHALIYTSTGFFIGSIQKYLDKDHAIPQMLLVFAIIIVIRILTWVMIGILESFNMNYPIVGPALYTALLTPIWFTLLGWLYRLPEEDSR